MVDFKQDQMIVILSAFTEVEVYGNIKRINDESITLTVKPAGLLKEGWDILCLVLGSDEIYEFYSSVEFLEANNIVIKRPEETEMTFIEKRKFNRVEYETGFVGRPMVINNISVAKSGKTFMGRIKNISAGGILAETDLCLPQDTIFCFKLKVNYFIDCTAIVKRVDENQEDGKYQMGCQFVNMNLEDTKAISIFVFKEQLRIRRRELYESVFK